MRARRLNALRTADIRLQRADPTMRRAPDRTTRTSCSHVLTPGWTARLCHADLAGPGSEISAIGVYSWFHLSALQKASRLGNEPQLSPAERAALARAVLADEAFALHFLQDVFAAGHIAGTWGDPSQRQGTHDYYNQNGLEVFTWTGGSRSIVLMGDAHMRPEDADVHPRACAPASSKYWMWHPSGPEDLRLRTPRPRRRRRTLSTSAAMTSCHVAIRNCACSPSRFAFSRRTWPRRPCPASVPASAPCRAFAARWDCSSVFPGPSTGARSTAASWPRRASAAQWRGSTCRSAQASDWTA